jgi:hypothetical protein
MQAPIAEAAAYLGDCPHALRRAASSARGVLYLMVMRQQPMDLHAGHSLIPNASQDVRQLSTRRRASPVLSQEVLQRRIVQHGVGQQALEPRVLVRQRV